MNRLPAEESTEATFILVFITMLVDMVAMAEPQP